MKTLEESKYPLHGEVRVHPTAGNIVKKCTYCNGGKSFGNTRDKFYVRQAGGKWHIQACIDVITASMYSDETQYAVSESNTIRFCPMCGRKL